MTVDVLPPSYTFGKVVGRVIQAIADTAEDVDALPQARAAAGTVTFTPAEVLRKVADDGTGTGAFVTAGPTPANLSSSGRVLDAEGRQGIWLVTGTYTVSFNLTDRSMKISPFTVVVTADHTDDAPLDLAVAAPPDPPSNVTLVVYTLPAGGTPGQVMTKTSSGSAYLDPVTPDLSSYATTTALTSGLAGKVNTSTYTSGLAAKVDTSTYTSGLAAKSDVLTVATTATANATLAAGKHTPVDATSGAKTMTLPTNATAGVLISVEKADASLNAVTITGTLRGVAASSIPLTSQYEVRTFLSEGSGSWRPISDHRTAASLSATFAKRTALFDTTSGPYFAGHRGGNLIHGEETIEGFRANFQAGFIPDTDVQLLSDGTTLACIHDFTVDRTMTGTGNVNTISKQAFRQMTVYPAVPGGPRNRPAEWAKLADEFGGRTILSVEPKSTAGVTAPTTALINDIVARGLQRSVLLQSFVYADCVAAAQAGIVAGFISDTVTPSQLVADKIEFCVVSTAVTNAQITALRAAGIRVAIYQIDTIGAYNTYSALGVEMFICGDPGQAASIRTRSDADPFATKIPWPGWSITNGGATNFRFNRLSEFGLGVEGGAGLSGSMMHKWAGSRAARCRIRWRARYAITSTTDLTRWGPSMYLGRHPSGDQAYGDAPATGANGYHAFARRNGALLLYRVDNGVGTQLATVATDPTIAANTAEASVDLELVITATGITFKNVTTGTSITSADTTYRYTDWVPGSVWNTSNAFISNVSVEDLP